jgi:hypothetical protein
MSKYYIAQRELKGIIIQSKPVLTKIVVLNLRPGWAEGVTLLFPHGRRGARIPLAAMAVASFAINHPSGLPSGRVVFLLLCS